MSGVGAPLPAQRLVNIQLLRGVAALLVVIAHATDMSLSVTGEWDDGPLKGFENFGAFGVDLFFVISGFVMAYAVSHDGGPRDAGRFLIRRWIRIAPPYLVIGFLMIPVDLAHGVAVDARSVLTLVLFLPVADAGAYTPPPLDVGWTLSFEFTFYLFVALLVLLRGARRLWVLLPGFALLALAGALLPLDTPFLLRWLTNPILLEFALGILIHLLWRRGMLHRAVPVVLVLAGLGVAVLVVQGLVGIPPISEYRQIVSGRLSALRALLWGLPAAAVFAATVTLPAPIGSWRDRGWRRLGDVSYSVYLVHTPAILLLGAVLKHLPIPGPAALVLGVLAGVGAGLPFYRFVERPLTVTLNRRYAERLQRRRQTA